MRIGNWPLLLLAIEYAIRFPDQYDQKWYVGTGEQTRCIAGWIAWFAGYRYDRETGVHRHELTGDERSIENAALFSLDLDPELYGVVPKFNGDNIAELEDFANQLFSGTLEFSEVLERVRDLAQHDGVTPTPIIVQEMERLGIISYWEAS